MSPVRWSVGLTLLAILLAGLYVWGRRALRVHQIERDEMTWQAPPASLPADLEGIEGIREESWTLSDGTRQRAYFVPGTNGMLVVMAHGSPGTALGMLPVGRGLARRGYGVLLLNLPSYAGSEGPRTWGANFREAVRAGVDFAAAQRDVRAIAAYGYSMSTAIVLQVAADDPRIGALVLLAPFTDIRAQRAHQHRSRVPGVAAMSIPTARWLGLAVDELDATQAARRIGDRPVLLIVGEQDPAIPLWMPLRLKQLAANAEIWVIPGAGHVGVARDAGDVYFDRIDEFLRAHLRVGTMPP